MQGPAQKVCKDQHNSTGHARTSTTAQGIQGLARDTVYHAHTSASALPLFHLSTSSQAPYCNRSMTSVAWAGLGRPLTHMCLRGESGARGPAHALSLCAPTQRLCALPVLANSAASYTRACNTAPQRLRAAVLANSLAAHARALDTTSPRRLRAVAVAGLQP